MGAGTAGIGTVSWIGAGVATGTVTGGAATVMGAVGSGAGATEVAGGVGIVVSGEGVAVTAAGASVVAGARVVVDVGLELARVLASAATEEAGGDAGFASGAGTASATSVKGASSTRLGIEGAPGADGDWARPWR